MAQSNIQPKKQGNKNSRGDGERGGGGWKILKKGEQLAYANKTKQFITSQKLGSCDLQQIANSVLNKVKSNILPLFNSPEVLSSASGKTHLFTKNFSKNSVSDDSGLPLPAFLPKLSWNSIYADDITL